jgi:hypothetical protein
MKKSDIVYPTLGTLQQNIAKKGAIKSSSSTQKKGCREKKFSVETD